MQHFRIAPAGPPMPHIARILSRCDRDEIETFIGVAIDLLDKFDGDPDLEANGDELDGSGAEDDFCSHNPDGPGCPIADAGEDDDPGGQMDEDEFNTGLSANLGYRGPGCVWSDDDHGSDARPWQRDCYGRRLAMVEKRAKVCA